MKLTRKNQAFIDAYLDTTSPSYLNGSQSAIRAGYSPKESQSKAAQLLKKPPIRTQVDALLAERKEAQKNTKEGILRDLYEMKSKTTDPRLKLQIIDRIASFEGFEAPKKVESKNSNLNINIDESKAREIASIARKSLQDALN